MIYLDYSANTPVSPAVLARFAETEAALFGNPNARHGAGRDAAAVLASATAEIASVLGCAPEEVIYTSGASEANNLAVKGVARASRHLGRHILATPLEHPSVSGPLTYLQEQGYEIDIVDVDREGRADLDSFRDLLRPDTVLAAVCAVDGELGVVQPIREIAEILKAYPNCRLHADMTQAAGKIPVDLDGVDTAAFSAHKIYGLNGSGLLFRRRTCVLDPLIHGGTGQSVYRSGTPTAAMAAALAQALADADREFDARLETVAKRNRALRRALGRYPCVRINSPAHAVPHILNLSVAGVRGAEFQAALDREGVCVSVKSACSAEGTPSRAVYAVSRDRKNALSSWRISLSHLTSEEEIAGFLAAFERCVKEFGK